MNVDSRDLVRLHGLARALLLPAWWLKAEAEAGRIPSLKAGRSRLFSAQAVAEVLRDRAANPSAAQEEAALIRVRAIGRPKVIGGLGR